MGNGTATLDYVEAASAEEACRALSDFGEDASILAGGVSLSVLMRHGLVRPRRLVSIRYARDLSTLGWSENGTYRIGAAVTHRAIETSREITAKFPVLVEMEKKLGSMQVRNAGTIGGNLCHADPAEDPPCVLSVLNATVHLRSLSGRRNVPLQQFFTGPYGTVLRPGELLTHIEIPKLPKRCGSAYLREGPRNALDFPIASAAALVTLEEGMDVCREARLALGAVGPVPLVCPLDGFRGERVTEAMIRQVGWIAAEYAEPVGDVFASADYKRHLVSVLAERAFQRAVAGAAAEGSDSREED